MIRPLFGLKPLLLVIGFWIVLTMVRAQAVDWVTTDGKTYHNVLVVKVEDDAVTILYENGGALVPLDKLPPDLQKRFHYDPVKAKIAAQARAKRDAEDALALQKEKDEADKLKQQKIIDDANAQGQAQATVQQQKQTQTQATP
ncbi:MAG: hypothetical protein LV481_08295 [Methylacidiphilales bacterium]|nr:hypothetical protein [Candidatus Methylacidiphilales bacterium]